MENRLQQRLIEALLRVPGVNKRNGRDALLAGSLSDIALNLNRDDGPRIDLTNIITQLDKLGRLKSGDWPLLILIDNALQHVKGVQVEQELEAIKEKLVDFYSQQQQPPPPPHPSPEPGPPSPLPCWVVLVLNFIIVLGVSWLIKDLVFMPCVSPVASDLSWSVFLVLLFHLIWRYLHPWLQDIVDSIAVGVFKFSGNLLNLLNVLSLSMFSDLLLWCLPLLSGGWLLVLALNPPPPFRPVETPPIIQGFSVQYLPTGPTSSYQPGDRVEVRPGQQVLVEARILGDWANPCEWYAANGVLLPGEKCSTLYTRSVAKGGDSLTLTVRSPCKTLETSASLFISP